MIHPSQVRKGAVVTSLILVALIMLIIPVNIFFVNQHMHHGGAQATSPFVSRSGSTLLLNGASFRFAGANIYWLGLDENSGGSVGGTHYPTQYNIDDALSTAKEMGASVIRSHTLGVSVGNALSVEPTLNSFNNSAFNTIDYAIYAAGKLGLKLIIPLTDGNAPCYYHGCRRTFVDWVYPNSTNDNLFFTDATVISDFEAYINHLLTHVNAYNGLALKDDPTIMAWESGNELDEGTSVTTNWLTTISQYTKSIDANHLFIDGGWTIDSGRLAITTVDMYTRHHYSGQFYTGGTGQSDDEYNGCNAVAASKVYFPGEYDWTEQHGAPITLSTYLPALETYQCPGTTSFAVAGDTYWSFFPHKDTNGFEQHSDGFTLHYAGDASWMRTQAQKLRSHAYTMSGLSVPVPGAITGAPRLRTPVNSGGMQLKWQGVPTAAYYQIERSNDNGATWTVVSPGTSPADGTVGGLTDNDDASVWTDANGLSTSLYRIHAFNLNNSAGPYSSGYDDSVSSAPVPSMGTPTPTPTNTPTPTPTNTPTPTPTNTPTPTPSTDTTPPTVAITSPANGATVTIGTTITINATASDNVGVARVTFSVQGMLRCTDTTAPYTCNWVVPNGNNVFYQLTAQAYDAAGNTASNSVGVTGKRR